MKIQPPSTLLSGPSGSGKTSSIITMLLAGIETFVIVTEPDGVASLMDSVARVKADINLLHWIEALPHSEGWGELASMIAAVSSMDQKQLSDQKDMGKMSFRPAAMRFLECFQNFVCDRTGYSYGDVSTWDDTRCLAVDSFTGWCAIGWGATVGYKPTANPGEWGIAQNFVLNMLRKVQSDRKCYFILTSHVEKEMDEMSGIKKVMVSAIGAKLAPKIPVMFSEVVLTSKLSNGKFNWATLDISMDLKNRALPNSSTLSPDFRPIVEAHKRRKLAASAVAAATTPQTPPTSAPVATGTPAPARVVPAAPLTPAKSA